MSMTTDYYYKNNESNFISISGEDHKDFLQNLITNDINACKKENPIYSCLLSPQGKFLVDFFIIEINGQYLIEVHSKFIENFFNKLQLYKLRSKVEIKRINDFDSYIFFNNENNIAIPNEIINFQDPRNKNIGTKVFITKDQNFSFEKLSLSKLNTIDYREILMKNLIPYSPEDLEENKSLLLENNFQNINAISWDKGCYVGQEITARMKHRSLLKKQIYSLEVISGKVDTGEALKNDQVHLGTVISKTNKFIVAMLKIEPINEIIKNNKLLETAGGKFKIIH